MKKIISRMLICCMLLSAAYPTITASAAEADNASGSESQVQNNEGYRVKFITNGARIELDGKKIKDGDILTTYESPSGWVESKSWYEDKDGNEVDIDNVKDPDHAPVVWREITIENKVDGDGAVKFFVLDGNPSFKIDGDYDWMGYNGAGAFEIIGISEDITVELVSWDNLDKDDNSDITNISLSDTKKTVPNIVGDINGDSKASAKDSMLIQRYAINLTDLDESQKQLADVDGNGRVTNADALQILRYTIKENNKFSIGEIKE